MMKITNLIILLFDAFAFLNAVGTECDFEEDFAVYILIEARNV